MNYSGLASSFNKLIPSYVPNQIYAYTSVYHWGSSDILSALLYSKVLLRMMQAAIHIVNKIIVVHFSS